MSKLLQILATAAADTPLFARGEEIVTAGRIRQTAADVSARIAGHERIYLYTNSAALFTAGLFAAAQAGATLCCPAHLQPHYLREIDAGILLTDEDVPVPSARRLALASGEAPPVAIENCDLDLIFYTSGVTGAPKHVPKKIAQLDAEACILQKLWGERAGRVFSTVSHQHIYGMLFRVFWPVISGRISEDRATEYWQGLAGRLSRGTMLVSSPAHLMRLPDAAVFAGSAPGLIFSSGAPLPFDAAQQTRVQLGALPIEVLGSTETGGVAWRRQDMRDALWTALPDVRIDIAEDGALGVRPPHAGSDFIATGDIAESVGGKFRLKGRADRIAKIDGKRVSLARVEEILLAHPFVEEAAAVDLPSRKSALGVIVMLNGRGRAALADKGAFRLSRDLRGALAGKLEPGERPKHWHFGAIPLNSQGKRTQSLLRAHFDTPPQTVLGRGTVALLQAEAAEITLELLPELIWFQGHFPGEPVLPGIAQVHLAALWAERLWQWKSVGANLSQLKFRRIMRPGDVVQLRLARDLERQRLKFAYRLGDAVASEGLIGGAG